MTESQAIGIRLENEFLKRVETVCREEHVDRSTALRMLLEEGYENYAKRKAAEEYKSGKLTISKAAEKAFLTVWEMEQYLLSKGFKSQYSIEDLKEELENTKQKK